MYVWANESLSQKATASIIRGVIMKMMRYAMLIMFALLLGGRCALLLGGDVRNVWIYQESIDKERTY